MSLDVTPDVVVLRDDDGMRIDLFGNRVRVKISGEQTGGAYAFLHFWLRENQALPPLHRHEFDEALHVLDGALTVRINDETVRAGVGTTVFVPRGAAHTIGTPDESPASFVALVAPAGFEQFFADLAALAAEHDQLAPETMADLNQRYGVEFLEAATPH